MAFSVGIRREDKNEWERRVPLNPKHVKELIENHNLDFYLQPSEIRVYSDGEYASGGAQICEDLSNCDVVFGVKEMPENFFKKGKTYVFFSHTIKGQYHSMPMLKKMMKAGCNLIDYEKITNENGNRLIYFSRHAGMAGMIDTIWALGERVKWEGVENPFWEMRQTFKYRDLKNAKEDLAMVGDLIREKGIPKSLVPVVFGITGYGNVSKGAQEVLDMLPVIEITPEELPDLAKNKEASANHVYKVIFKEKHTVKPIDPEGKFNLKEYYEHPEKYTGIFEDYLPYLTVLVHAIFWNENNPRLVTRHGTCKMWKQGHHKMKVIGDLSCDVNGGIEMNTHCTSPGAPIYSHDPISGRDVDSLDGPGFVVLAVDNLPCELPKESSDHFSKSLVELVPGIVTCNYSADFDSLTLPKEVKKALVLHQGKLTENFKYLKKFL